jgi:hypothetical protein
MIFLIEKLLFLLNHQENLKFCNHFVKKTFCFDKKRLFPKVEDYIWKILIFFDISNEVQKFQDFIQKMVFNYIFKELI